MWQVIQGDAIETMRGLPPASVDTCITDPPYGTTACAWDSVIPFAPMWAELKRIVKPKGAIVLFGSQPFTSALVMSNPQMFRHQWVWDKHRPSNPMLAKVQPLKNFEDVVVFSREAVTYQPQGLIEADGPRGGVNPSKTLLGFGKNAAKVYEQEFYNYPKSIIRFPADNSDNVHPTQKPVDLLRYLVRTYTNPGDTVLDFTCGSGTTGVACEIEGRDSINIDSDGHYCDVARARIMRASGIACDIPKPQRATRPEPLFDLPYTQDTGTLRPFSTSNGSEVLVA